MTPSSASALTRAIDAIDQANAADPNLENVDGRPVAKALIYGRRMSRVLSEFESSPSPALAIAVRAQHIRRWQVPRSSLPMGLVGYKKWRSGLARFHAQCANEIALAAGFDLSVAERVGELIRKLRLASDPEAQTLEDVACVVFVRHHLEEFASKHEPAKLEGIVVKTLAKMSPRGRAVGMASELPDPLRSLLERVAAG